MNSQCKKTWAIRLTCKKTEYEHDVVFSVFSVSEHRYHKEIHNPLFMSVRADGILL